MSASPPATPPSANIKELATKNQLLQKVETDIQTLLSKLQYSETNTEFNQIAEFKTNIDKAVGELKREAISLSLTSRIKTNLGNLKTRIASSKGRNLKTRIASSLRNFKQQNQQKEKKPTAQKAAPAPPVQTKARVKEAEKGTTALGRFIAKGVDVLGQRDNVKRGKQLENMLGDEKKNTPLQGGAKKNLGELLRKYKTKIYLEKAEIQALQLAVNAFNAKFDQAYNDLHSILNDKTKEAALTKIWKTEGFDMIFKSPSDYISNLFTQYQTALQSETEAIKKAFPNYTEAQIKAELEKRIKGNLSSAGKNAAPPDVTSVGTGQGEGSTSALGSTSDPGGKNPSSAMGSAVGKGLMDGFNILYTIFGALGAVLVLGTFFLSSIDILKFSVLEVWQYVMLFISPNMFNKDTLDFSTLLYAKNSEKDEPYTIFLQQEFISYMFKLVSYFVNTVIFQVVIFMILKFLKAMGKIEFDEGLDFGPAKKAIGVMVITIASAFIQNTYYNTTFLNSVQPEMIASTNSIRNMAERMYDNMSNNSEFLNNVVQENLTECIRIINSQADRTSVAGSMIFTLSLYNFFKINISSDSPSFEIIRDVFTIKERKVRSINPTSYMYFQQNVFIPNLFSMIEPYITSVKGGKKEAIRKDVANRVAVLNQQLMGLFVVPLRRSSFRNYIYFGWILALAFVVGIYSIYREEIDLIYDNFVKPFLNAINEFFWNIVMPWDIRTSKKEETKE